jgi:hypothetical protein
MIIMLKGHLEESRRTEETLEDQKQCLEFKIEAQKKKQKRHKILKDYLKERNDDLNHLES